jgi:hypothetical protein
MRRQEDVKEGEEKCDRTTAETSKVWVRHEAENADDDELRNGTCMKPSEDNDDREEKQQKK